MTLVIEATFHLRATRWNAGDGRSRDGPGWRNGWVRRCRNLIPHSVSGCNPTHTGGTC